MPVWTARCRNQDPGCVSMGAIQRGTSWATIPKTLNRARTVHAPCAHRARTVRQRPQSFIHASCPSCPSFDDRPKRIACGLVLLCTFPVPILPITPIMVLPCTPPLLQLAPPLGPGRHFLWLLAFGKSRVFLGTLGSVVWVTLLLVMLMLVDNGA